MWCLEVRSCYGFAMNDQGSRNPPAGVSDEERHIMERLLRRPPEPHKAASKPPGARADAQRRRREKECKHPNEASRGV